MMNQLQVRLLRVQRAMRMLLPEEVPALWVGLAVLFLEGDLEEVLFSC